MENSEHLQLISLVSGDSISGNWAAPTADLGSFDIGNPPSIEGALADSVTGVGTSSITEINVDTTSVSSPGSPGGTVEITPEAIVAHEFFEHAWRRDTGQELQGRNPGTGTRYSEEAAVQTENLYRRAVGLPERKGY
jgi:hypothetical protein